MRYRLRGGAFDGNELQVIWFMDEDQQDVNKCERLGTLISFSVRPVIRITTVIGMTERS